MLVVAAAASSPAEEIQDLYRRGLRGDATAVVQCIEKLEAVLQTDPRNQLARVYLGSTYTLRSRDLGFGPQKLQTLRRGIAVMDEAVAAAPDDARVRLARALTTSSLPFFVGRAESARRDFAALAEIAERSPADFSAGDLQIIFYNAALASMKASDKSRAAALLERAQQHPADPALAAEVTSAHAKLR